MRDSFDAFEYLEYLRQRWRVIVSAAAVALLATLCIGLLLPKRYTATVSILIEPPGSSDVRTATAISPVYLESLRSFERFATSDSLFAQAVQRFHLQDADGKPAIEGLKRSVLRVSKLRDTRILEISATLQDPKLAHELVAYIAEQTVAMSRAETLAADRDAIDESRRQLDVAAARLESARKGALDDSKLESAETLNGEVAALVELQVDVRRQLTATEADAAGYEQREQGLKGPDGDFALQQRRASQARAVVLAKRLEEVSRTLAEKSSLLSRRASRQGEVQSELKAAQVVFETASARVRDLEASAGNRGERLRIIDPGIVPQRPSSPDVVLNMLAGLLLALVAVIVYLSVRFVYREREAPRLRAPVSRGGIPA